MTLVFCISLIISECFNHKKQPLTHPIPSNLERPVLYNTANFNVQLDSNNINQRQELPIENPVPVYSDSDLQTEQNGSASSDVRLDVSESANDLPSYPEVINKTAN